MKTQALKGMRDLLPNEQTLRDYIQGKILETYRASGFERISTPMLEDMELSLIHIWQHRRGRRVHRDHHL